MKWEKHRKPPQPPPEVISNRFELAATVVFCAFLLYLCLRWLLNFLQLRSLNAKYMKLAEEKRTKQLVCMLPSLCRLNVLLSTPKTWDVSRTCTKKNYLLFTAFCSCARVQRILLSQRKSGLKSVVF